MVALLVVSTSLKYKLEKTWFSDFILELHHLVLVFDSLINSLIKSILIILYLTCSIPKKLLVQETGFHVTTGHIRVSQTHIAFNVFKH